MDTSMDGWMIHHCSGFVVWQNVLPPPGECCCHVGGLICQKQYLDRFYGSKNTHTHAKAQGFCRKMTDVIHISGLGFLLLWLICVKVITQNLNIKMKN